MKKGMGSDSDSSGHGPSEDGDSTDTEGPQNESDEIQEENSLDDNDCTTENEYEKLRLKKLPKCLHVGRQVADECNVDVERHNARRFVRTLRSDLIPMVLTLRSNIEVDEALQNFASEYCQGIAIDKTYKIMRKNYINIKIMIYFLKIYLTYFRSICNSTEDTGTN